MGLCKCPKKRVTNQFCFEHRVNVCEHCLVSNHPKCQVMSYLKWLQDSDYQPICQMCKQDLRSEDCIRLLCYHIFHWSCFDQFAKQLPPETAPAGYTCPTCQGGLFPSVNLVSPVADELRQILSRAAWARMGLGMSPIEDSAISIQTTSNHQSQFNQSININEMTRNDLASTSMSKDAGPTKHILSMDNFPSQARMDRIDAFPTSSSAFNSNAFTSRKLIDAANSNGLPHSYHDHDDDKYKRKSAMEMFSRWFKSRAPLRRNRFNDPRLIYKRWFILTVLIFLGICTIILIFARLGRGGTNYDPLLDPKLNPNIRVGDGAISNDGNPDSM